MMMMMMIVVVVLMLMVTPTNSQETGEEANQTELMNEMRADWWNRSYTRQRLSPDERYYMTQVAAFLFVLL